LLILLSVPAFACLRARGAETAPPGPPAKWFDDKDLVRVTYERARREDLKELARKVGLHRPSADFLVTSVGEGGRTGGNTVTCLFRVNRETTQRFEKFHKLVTSMGFEFQKGSPFVLAYKVSPQERRAARKMLSQAKARIVRRVSEILPEFRPNSVNARGFKYHHKGESVFLLIDDLSSVMRETELAIGNALRIHLPSYGYIIHLTGAKPRDGVVGLYVRNEILQAVREEFSDLIRHDKHATVLVEGAH